jgi:hypothetical protein
LRPFRDLPFVGFCELDTSELALLALRARKTGQGKSAGTPQAALED